MAFGEAVKRLRLSRGWKQQELSRRSGVQQGYISAIERDEKTNPTQETISKLAAAFEISVAELLMEAGIAPGRSRPVEGLHPAVVEVAQRVGKYLDDDAWLRVAGFIEGLASGRVGQDVLSGEVLGDVERQPRGQKAD